MSASFFSTLPKGTQIRRAAVAVLLSQGTIAGQAIADSPLDPLPAGTDVAVNLYSAERRDTMSAAGGRPTLKVQYTLTIQLVYVCALAAQAVLQSDILKQQILDALFEDPVWPSMMEQPASIEERREEKMDGERYRIEHAIAIITAWREPYGARGTTVLSQAGAAPGQAGAVLEPLTQVNNTYVAGSAPGPDGQGSVQTTFTSETQIQPA